MRVAPLVILFLLSATISGCVDEPIVDDDEVVNWMTYDESLLVSNETDDSADNNGTDDSADNNGTDDSADNNETNECPDSDGDEVCDDEDQCENEDDTIDENDNGEPDCIDNDR